MVNRGKPSRGCENCRKKKIRCDQNKPECSQCQKYRMPCSFRNQLDLLFVHQSEKDVKEATERKARKRRDVRQPKALPARHAKVTGVQGDDLATPATQEAPVQLHLSTVMRRRQSEAQQIQVAVSASLSDRAITFFLKHYVVSNNNHSRGQYEYLPQLCSRAGADPTLLLSVAASGLAALANVSKSSDLNRQALQMYGKAMRMAQLAIVSPELVTTDSTLLSVLLLGRFESITYQDKGSKDVWAIHLEGAAKIIQMRGKAQFKTATGRRIFQLFFNYLLIHCVTSRLHVMPEIIAIRQKASDMYDTSSPDWRLASIILDWVEFIAGVQEKHPSSQYILSQAMQLDKRLVELYSDMHSMAGIWAYQVIWLDSDSSHTYTYHGFYHVYKEYWVAQVWNSVRGIRLLLNEVIVKHLTVAIQSHKSASQAPPQVRSQYVESRRVLEQLSAEICASIPQYTGKLSTRKQLSGGASSTSGSPPRELSPSTDAPSLALRAPLSPPYSDSSSCSPPAFQTQSLATLKAPVSAAVDHYSPSTPQISPSVGQAVNFFLWPLFVVGMLSTTDLKLRVWIMENLGSVGQMNGNKQADALAWVLANQDEKGPLGFSLWREEEDQKHVDLIGG